ncbi:aldehyde dehydrogenase (NADP(+)) [Novipirellula caenicola]|uniref:Alpha-ketoglutaric semialdehyde dehydrogenase 2 n=1 Tax=Novipirellula caenicola TaxID=1536901 RepID=A0ABP9VLI5_9BACT
MPTARIQGKQLIGAEGSATNAKTFVATNPGTGTPLDPPFHEANGEEVDRAMTLASESAEFFSNTSYETRAKLLEAIADGLMDAGQELLDRCHAETALPMNRLVGERARTVNQTRMFAEMIREGSWVEAKIDHGDADRTPAPKPDVRSMLISIGPVVVFGASNFPLAISVAGTDTTTAFAAGCPVVCKAHPAHPGTCEMIGNIIADAVKATGLPAGIFSLLQGQSHEVGHALVEHPATAAVAFTGSIAGGRALFDTANRRRNPIPVYAEMGSINPVFVLPGAIEERAEQIAQAFIGSLTMGVGQFCTNPGLILIPSGEQGDRLIQLIAANAAAAAPGTMLHAGIHDAFNKGVARIKETSGVQLLSQTEGPSDQACCTIAVTDVATLRRERSLMEEIFGPCSTIVRYENADEMVEVAQAIEGQLTATLHGSDSELSEHPSLIRSLETKVGRLIFNGFPTGIEVCHAMVHGGPYPATSDAHFTSIGPAAIKRFTRPLCFQDFPNDHLPPELQDANPRCIMRMVNGVYTRES